MPLDQIIARLWTGAEHPVGGRMAEGNENVTLEKKCYFHILLGSHKEEASDIIL